MLYVVRCDTSMANCDVTNDDVLESFGNKTPARASKGRKNGGLLLAPALLLLELILSIRGKNMTQFVYILTLQFGN